MYTTRLLKKMLLAKAYKDESEIIRIEGEMPAIVSKEDFEKVQEILKMRRKKPGINKNLQKQNSTDIEKKAVLLLLRIFS